MEIELANQQRDIKITEWFGQYGRRLLAFVRSKIQDIEVAEDTAQDVWLQLTRQQDLEEIEQIGNWLFTAARNRVTDYYRKKKTVPFSQIAWESGENQEDNAELSDDLVFDHWLEQNLPDALLETQEFWDELNRALEQLPVEQREVFVTHELNDIPFREMAEKTGLSINTLLARKRYAVLRLREHFEDWLND
ncbi:MAG: RNA polymerase sigma factor [Saprospiraceae bacterium]|nr:RNA polymerase sigma factor [Saprospiraceae bacterium]